MNCEIEINFQHYLIEKLPSFPLNINELHDFLQEKFLIFNFEIFTLQYMDESD